jgi:hypothetical protein
MLMRPNDMIRALHFYADGGQADNLTVYPAMSSKINVNEHEREIKKKLWMYTYSNLRFFLLLVHNNLEHQMYARGQNFYSNFFFVSRCGFLSHKSELYVSAKCLLFAFSFGEINYYGFFLSVCGLSRAPSGQCG